MPPECFQVQNREYGELYIYKYASVRQREREEEKGKEIKENSQRLHENKAFPKFRIYPVLEVIKQSKHE